MPTEAGAASRRSADGGGGRELVRQAGDPRAEQAVDPLGTELAGARKGGGDRVHAGRELHLVERARAEEAPVHQRGRVVAGPQRPVEVLAEAAQGPSQVGQHLRRGAGRDRRPGRPASGDRALEQSAQAPERGLQQGIVGQPPHPASYGPSGARAASIA
jgi:hypothetical protein